MAIVRIPPTLRAETGGQRQIEVAASDVGGALESLIASFPALADRLLEGGQVPQFLTVFVDGEDIRARDGLATSLQPTSRVLLLPAMAGGEPRPTAHRIPHAI